MLWWSVCCVVCAIVIGDVVIIALEEPLRYPLDPYTNTTTKTMRCAPCQRQELHNVRGSVGRVRGLVSTWCCARHLIVGDCSVGGQTKNVRPVKDSATWHPETKKWKRDALVRLRERGSGCSGAESPTSTGTIVSNWSSAPFTAQDQPPTEMSPHAVPQGKSEIPRTDT